MDAYFEVKALPSAEILQFEVVSHLIGRLHLHLPQFDGTIGLGFPGYGQERS